MLTIRLAGGLGNQFFQRAYGMALEARGYEVQYDISALRDGTHAEYSLHEFGSLPLEKGTGLAIYEKSLAFDPCNLHPPKDGVLIGYWQSEKYFAGIENKVRAEFSFQMPYRPGQPNSPAKLLNEIYGSGSIAVHVRRGDYVSRQNYHGLLSMDYYNDALGLIFSSALPRIPKVYVFSDDPEYCKANFSTDYHVVTGTTKYEDMKLMSACQDIVIANSSFSWWAAWLGDYQLGHRTVVAPKRWFTDEDANTAAKDICPERWIRL